MCLLRRREAARALTLTRRPCKWVSRRAAGTVLPLGPEMEMQPLSAEERVTAGVLVPWLYSPWHMAAWWRHVLLSRMRRRAAPCYFLLPHLHFSSLLCECSPLKVRCDHAQVVLVPRTLKWEVCAVSNVSLCVPGAYQVLYYMASEPTPLLHSLVLFPFKFQVGSLCLKCHVDSGPSRGLHDHLV